MATSQTVLGRGASGEAEGGQPEASDRARPGEWARPVIEHVTPRVDGGLRPAKTSVGELLRVEADVFADGHDELWCEVRHRPDRSRAWTRHPMRLGLNDRWSCVVPIEAEGPHRFLVRALVDVFGTWVHDLLARSDAGLDVRVDLEVGAVLVTRALAQAKSTERVVLEALRDHLASPCDPDVAIGGELGRWTNAPSLRQALSSARLRALMVDLGTARSEAVSETVHVVADRPKARFSTWYEMFPRSASPEPGRHGTFDDVIGRLDYVARMGFDILYLPPIHPIGRTARKGRNGAVHSEPGDPGSPWAIGGPEGGHCAIHPELGTFDDFGRLVRAAADRGIDVALDLAFQASPDHPWVTEHPEWFAHRPDGSIKCAENPPKRYEDIFPLDFESTEWRALWSELLGVVLFWIDHGVTVFRVDNPHTKPFAFWEWLLGEVRRTHPHVIFLSEAFTRPRIMEELAKIGFTQSYTYFTWRTTKWELETYMHELTGTDVAAYFRPNFWPTTPDILTSEMQEGGRGAFLSRFVLAATLSASYGIYGPAFELQEHVARELGSEEFQASEKYEVRVWDLEDPRSLSGFIGQVNRIRHEHAALQFNDSLCFHAVDNEQIIAYSKAHRTPAGSDVIVVVVNLDHHNAQSGWISLDLDALDVAPGTPYVVHDLLTDARYSWDGPHNFVKLDPAVVPAHIFSVESTPGPADRGGPP
ncbi:MAG TPA: alpha-1,4-glucan--maltose-1-phosphate maltosyltransferase [Acidimicrobiales bacterium]|nr:alpha-1,4-glucan--maltose-1-phosphate maltosyltransferase [Acidimicrobiales bacterium]